MTSLSAELFGKQLGILHELLPQARQLGILSDPNDVIHELVIRCSAAEERDEPAPVHSITSSARASNVSGTVRPSALAVLRLMTSSNFVG
jgi:hypothetical protein